MRAFTDINECRQFVVEDFARFVEYAASLEKHRPPWFHYTIANWLQSRRRGETIRKWISRVKCIYGFRLAAKTWLLRQYVLWRWLRCPLMQVVIHSSTDDVSRRMAKAVKKALRDNPLLDHLCPKTATGSYEFNLHGQEPEQGYSLTCAGINTSLTSSRADIYIFDDPEPDVNPESMHDRIIDAFIEAKHILHRPDRHLDHFKTATIPIAERTQLIVVGQPHCESTVYFPATSDFTEDGESGHPLRGSKFLILPVITRNGEWTWREMMESKYWNEQEGRPDTVEEVRKKFTTRNWECQMMINPMYAATRGAVLNMDMVKERLRLVPEPIMAIDPADSETGCEWGIVIGGIVSGEHGHQLHICYMGGVTGEVYEGDMSDATLGESVWRTIFDIGFEFGVKKILLECNLKSAQMACRRYIRKTDTRAIVEEIRVRSNKLRRITEALEQPINNGMVTCNPEVKSDPANMRQFTRLKFTKLPSPIDRLDALSMLINHLNELPELTNPKSMLTYDIYSSLKFPSQSRVGSSGLRLAK